jgi:hypothetical protein
MGLVKKANAPPRATEGPAACVDCGAAVVPISPSSLSPPRHCATCLERILAARLAARRAPVQVRPALIALRAPRRT